MTSRSYKTEISSVLSVLTLVLSQYCDALSTLTPPRSYSISKPIIQKYQRGVIDYDSPFVPELELKTNASPVKEKQFQWEKQWWPVAVEEFTDLEKPHKMMLLGNDIVIWFDGENWRTFEDSCPHRGVPLSEGRVEKNGELMCAYHAWTFNGEGECTSIPQTPTDEKHERIRPKACVKSYPTQVKQGLIWVWGEIAAPGSDLAIQAAMKQPRLIEELTDPHFDGRIGEITYNFRDLPYGYDMFMENVLDPAHVVVSHHGIVGNRYNDTKPINMVRTPSRSETPVDEGGELQSEFPEDQGFKYFVKVKGEEENSNTESSNDFRPPCLNKITTEYANDAGKLILALYCTPTKPGYSRHIGAQILIKDKEGKKYPPGLGLFALPMPKWLLHITASFFLHQDQVFLHHQERMLYSSSDYAFGNFENNAALSSDPSKYSSLYFMPNTHDRQISHFRQWIFKKAGGGVKWGKSALNMGMPPRLRSKELFDVYHAHTENCKVCKEASSNIKLIRNFALGIGIVLMSVLKSLKMKVLSGTVLGAMSFVSHQLYKLFFKYEYTHQNNN